MEIEQSYVRESTKDGIAFEGRIVNFDLDGAIILKPRVKRQETSPDYTVGYLHQPKGQRSRWVEAGVAWLASEKKPGSIPGGKYLSMVLKLKSGDLRLAAFPQVDADGVLLDDWAVEMGHGNDAANASDNPF